jgi:hypothetical protein
LVARLLWEQDVAGSNPVVPTIFVSCEANAIDAAVRYNTVVAYMRVWFNGRTSAFQADNAGSIPVTRSTKRQANLRGWLFSFLGARETAPRNEQRAKAERGIANVRERVRTRDCECVRTREREDTDACERV